MVDQKMLRKCEGKLESFSNLPLLSKEINCLNRLNYLFHSTRAQRFLSYHMLWLPSRSVHRKKKTDSFNSFLIRLWPIFNYKKFNGYKFIMHLVPDQAIQMFCLHLDPNIKKTRIRICDQQRYYKTIRYDLILSLAKIF